MKERNNSSEAPPIIAGRLIQGTWIIIFLISSTATAIGVFGATHLRMLNDDYWHAFVSERGFIGAMKEWWVTTSGDLFAMGSNTLLNGLPLVHFSWPLTSFVPYMTTFIAVGVTGVVVITRFSVWRTIGLRYVAALGLLFSFTWWVFLWTPLINSDSPRTQIVLGMTHWQNLNTAYVIPPATLLVIYLILRRSSLGGWKEKIARYVLGVLVGLSGMVIGTTTIIWMLLAAFLIWLSGIATTRSRLVQGFLILLGSASGLVLSYSSPGSRNRASQIGPEFDTSIQGIFGLSRVFIQGGQDIFSSLWHPGTLLVALIIFPLVSISSTVLPFAISANKIWATSASLAAFAVVFAIVNRLSEVWIGASWWHTTTLQLLLYLALITGSCATGLSVASKLDPRRILTLAVVSMVSATIGVGAVQISTQSMIDRENEWSAGPAVIPILGWDIDVIEGWQYFYWTKIMEFRDTPDRLGFLDD